MVGLGTVTVKGTDDMFRAGTSFVGFLTSIVALITALVILRWWVSRWRRERRKDLEGN